MITKTTVIVWAYVLTSIFLFNVDNLTSDQHLGLQFSDLRSRSTGLESQ